MNILSLFDGISCGQLALRRANIKYDNYYASEIDKHAIQVTMNNFPNTIQLGDVRNIKIKDLPKIDLLIGGSPCQSFSMAGKKEGIIYKNIEITSLDKYLEIKDEYDFKGESYLFWEYVRLYKELNPKYFLFENVLMSSKWKKVISDTLNVDPILIDSAKVSIQSRKRLYWTNIKINKEIQDKKIFYYNEYSKQYDTDLVLRGRGLNKLSRKRSRVYSTKSEKLPTLLKEQENKPTDSIVIKHMNIYRYPTREEAEKMQTVPIGYTNCVFYNKAMGLLGNSWTVDVISYIFNNLNIYNKTKE